MTSLVPVSGGFPMTHIWIQRPTCNALKPLGPCQGLNHQGHPILTFNLQAMREINNIYTPSLSYLAMTTEHGIIQCSEAGSVDSTCSVPTRMSSPSKKSFLQLLSVNSSQNSTESLLKGILRYRFWGISLCLQPLKPHSEVCGVGWRRHRPLLKQWEIRRLMMVAFAETAVICMN